eukprot:g662.t1
MKTFELILLVTFLLTGETLGKRTLRKKETALVANAKVVAKVGPVTGWNNIVEQKFPETKVKDMVLYGSHDAGTQGNVISKPKPFSIDVASTQSLTITQQLNAGYRMFDLRFKMHNEQWHIWHGPGLGLDFVFEKTLQSVFEEVETFATANTKEIIILRIKISSESQGHLVSSGSGSGSGSGSDEAGEKKEVEQILQQNTEKILTKQIIVEHEEQNAENEAEGEKPAEAIDKDTFTKKYKVLAENLQAELQKTPSLKDITVDDNKSEEAFDEVNINRDDKIDSEEISKWRKTLPDHTMVQVTEPHLNLILERAETTKLKKCLVKKGTQVGAETLNDENVLNFTVSELQTATEKKEGCSPVIIMFHKVNTDTMENYAFKYSASIGGHYSNGISYKKIMKGQRKNFEENTKDMFAFWLTATANAFRIMTGKGSVKTLTNAMLTEAKTRSKNTSKATPCSATKGEEPQKKNYNCKIGEKEYFQKPDGKGIIWYVDFAGDSEVWNETMLACDKTKQEEILATCNKLTGEDANSASCIYAKKCLGSDK